MPPLLRIVAARGLDLAVWEWPGAGPPVVLAHATGFHGRCWDPVVEALPGRRMLAFESRGHGRSAAPDPPYCWPDFGRDLAEAARVLGVEGAVGVGHSMGGHAVALCAALRPETFSSLLLVDPTIFAEPVYGRPQRGDSAFILKRRNRWASPQEMFDRFRDRPPFVTWRPEALRAYCDYGVIADGDGYRLACPPAVEQSIYAASNAAEANIHPLLGGIAVPVTVVRGGIPWSEDRFDLASSPTAPGIAAEFLRGRDLCLDGRSHYIPMETPELVAGWIRDAVE